MLLRRQHREREREGGGDSELVVFAWTVRAQRKRVNGRKSQLQRCIAWSTVYSKASHAPSKHPADLACKVVYI